VTTNERNATIMLIDAIRAARSGLEMAAATKTTRINEDDRTFAMEQAMLVVASLTAALDKCRAANVEAHRLVPALRVCGYGVQLDGRETKPCGSTEIAYWDGHNGWCAKHAPEVQAHDDDSK
jgi:hypothetical protein